MKIKVAIVISNLGFGGAERQVVELCKHLDRSDFEVYLVSLSDHVPLSSELGGMSDCLWVIPKRSRFDFLVAMQLARFIRREGIDIVHGFLFDAEIATRLATWMNPSVVCIGSERNTRNTNGRLKRMIYRYTSRSVDLCIANSRAGADFNRQVSGLPESAYRVVYNSVDTERFLPRDEQALRQSLGIDPKDRVVGMFGNFKRQKNHPLLLRAASRVLKQIPGVRFVFVGDKIEEGYSEGHQYKRHVSELVDELGIRDDCLFLGHREEVHRYYNICDLTVLPSLFEGTPNVVLESMACGVPVVATDVSDVRYLIPEGKVGFVIDSGDEEALADRLLRLLRDDASREEMGREARRWVESRFSIETMTASMAKVYKEAVASGRERKGAP